MNYSKQRELIFRAVSDSTVHPTAEAIYTRLKGDHPRLSLATVYRNLNQLRDMGKIRSLHLPDSPERFDGNLSPHCHFQCRRCGQVFDLDGSIDWRRIFEQPQPHHITGCEMVLFGVCEGCLKTEC